MTEIKSGLPDSNSFLEEWNSHSCQKKVNPINLCGIYFLLSYFPVVFFPHVAAEVIIPFIHRRAARSLKSHVLLMLLQGASQISKLHCKENSIQKFFLFPKHYEESKNLYS